MSLGWNAGMGTEKGTSLSRVYRGKAGTGIVHPSTAQGKGGWVLESDQETLLDQPK